MSPESYIYLHPTGDRPWTRLAACRGMDPDIWHPRKGHKATLAKAICADCPVRLPCLEYALDAHEHFGVWGGTDERARKQIRRNRRKEAA